MRNKRVRMAGMDGFLRVSFDSISKDILRFAAHEIFIRYGYRRTTMGDLAKASEMSRPALYLLYANKEEVFRAVIVRYFNEAKQRAELAVAECSGLSDKLAALMAVWVEDSYAEVAGSPAAGEIYETGHSIAEDLKNQFCDLYASQILSVLMESDEVDHASLESRGLILDRVAELLARSTLGLKREVRDLDQLQTLLSDTRKIHMAALLRG